MKRRLLYAVFLIAACGVAEGQQAGERAAVNPLARLDLKDFAETVQRPLFAATRRPPAPPALIRHEAPPPPPPGPPSLTLVGVLIDAQGARALVRPNPTAKIRSLRRGDEIEGWTVVEIGRQRIVIGRDARTSAVAMFTAKPGPVKPPPRQLDDE
jgi:hypothetical protein